MAFQNSSGHSQHSKSVTDSAHLRGDIMMAASVVIMALAPTLNKFAFTTIAPLLATLVNAIFAVIFSVLLVLLSRKQVQLIVDRNLVFSGLFNGFGLLCLFDALHRLHPAEVAFLSRSGHIIFSTLGGALFLKEKLHKHAKIGIPVLLLGVFLFSRPVDSPLGTALPNDTSGLVTVTAAAFLFTLSNMLVKRQNVSAMQRASSVSLLAINFYSLLVIVGAVVFSPLRFNALAQASTQSLLLIFMAAFTSSFIGLWLYYESLRYTTFVRATVIRACGPVVVALFAMPFLEWSLSSVNIVGGILILTSALLMSVRSFKKSSEQIRSPSGAIQVRWHGARSKHVKHFDSVMIFVRSNDGFLMVRNPQRGWEIPGGHREGDEAVIAVAQREAFEEAGIAIKDVTVVGSYELPNGHRTIITTAAIESWHEIPTEFETIARAWFQQLPDDLSFKDGLYECVVGRLGEGK